MFKYLISVILLNCIVFSSLAMETILVNKNADFCQVVRTQSPAIYVFNDSCYISGNTSLYPGSILKFNGGSISGTGVISGDNCFIDAPKCHIFTESALISGFSNSEISAHWFGAKGDNVSDDAPAINRAIASSGSSIIKLDNGTYKINSPISLTSGKRLHCAGKIVYSGDESAIILLGQNIELNISTINQSSNSYIGSAITFADNVYNSNINVNSIYGFKYGLNLSPRTSGGKNFSGIQYCKISWQVINCDYGIYFDLAGGVDPTLKDQVLWANENQFNGGRLCCKYGIFCTNVPSAYVSKVDLINGNVFNCIGFEGTANRPIKAITLDYVWYNKFHDLRLAESMVSMDSTWIDLNQCGHIDLTFKNPLPYTVVKAQKCHHIEIDAPFYDRRISYGAGYDHMTIVNEASTYNPKDYNSSVSTQTYKLLRRKYAPDGELKQLYMGKTSSDTVGGKTQKIRLERLLQIDAEDDPYLLDFSSKIKLMSYDNSDLSLVVPHWVLINHLDLEVMCSVASNSKIRFINTDNSEFVIQGQYCVYSIRKKWDNTAEFIKILDF